MRLGTMFDIDALDLNLLKLYLCLKHEVSKVYYR